MTDLTQRFEQAATDSKSLDSRPDNTTMLKLYSLYKQGAQGDNTSEAPGDMIGKFKHKAWSELQGMSKEDAMQRYIDLVESLR